MIDNKLAAVMGERLEKISAVSKATGLSRTTLTNLYYKRAKNVSLETLDALCSHFGCDVGDLFVRKKEQTPKL